MIRRNFRQANLTPALDAAVPAKIKRRSTYLPGDTIAPESIKHFSVGGQLALRARARYEQDGVKMVELLTWVYTPHTIAHFYAMATATEAGILQGPFDQMVQTASVP